MSRLALHLAILLPIVSAYVDEPVLDIEVAAVPNVIEPEVCRQLIDIAEREGFSQTHDSIDFGEEYNLRSQDISVYDTNVDSSDKVVTPPLWDVIEPLLGRLKKLLVDWKSLQHEPSADWIFMRKYGQGTSRYMLKAHHDSNTYSLNLALTSNSETENGGLFVLRPPVPSHELQPDAVPPVPAEWLTYAWLQKVQRVNTTHVMFPDMSAGTAVMHNFTVYHGVAPVSGGIKYSLLFFFDMEGRHQPTKRVQVRFHNRRACDRDQFVDIFWMQTETVAIPIAENVGPGEEIGQGVIPDHVFEIRIHNTDTLVARVIVRPHMDEIPIVDDCTEDDAASEADGLDLPVGPVPSVAHSEL